MSMDTKAFFIVIPVMLFSHLPRHIDGAGAAQLGMDDCRDEARIGYREATNGN